MHGLNFYLNVDEMDWRYSLTFIHFTATASCNLLKVTYLKIFHPHKLPFNYKEIIYDVHELLLSTWSYFNLIVTNVFTHMYHLSMNVGWCARETSSTKSTSFRLRYIPEEYYMGTTNAFLREEWKWDPIFLGELWSSIIIQYLICMAILHFIAFEGIFVFYTYASMSYKMMKAEVTELSLTSSCFIKGGKSAVTYV